jgi:hypothetical protein
VAGVPVTVPDRRSGHIALVLCLCLLSACSSQTIQFPALPAAEEAPHDDPARDAQARLLTEAHRAFSQARYSTAVLFFTRFMERVPDSPRLAEAGWWVGRAYEQLGDFGAAMAHYRVVASGELSRQLDGPRYEQQALARLDELRQQQADRSGHGRQLVLRVAAGHLPEASGLMPWLQGLVEGGVTGLILEPEQNDPAGAPTSVDALQRIVAESHRAGLALWLSVDIHQPEGMTLKPEWLAETVHASPSDVVTPRRPDLAHPGYQAALEELVRRLAQSGCDGLFLPARPVPGLASEWSEDSFKAFLAAFDVRLSPQALLGEPAADPLGPRNPEEATYWRWVGWKALQYAKLAARLRTVLRERHPTATLLVEVHHTTLRAPVQGLEQYGEDITELAQRTGGALVVRRGGPDDEALLDQLSRHLGAVERVWVAVPTAAPAGPASIAELKRGTAGWSERSRWPTIVMPQ